MAKVLIVFGSSTGNTRFTSSEIGRILSEAGHEVTLLDVAKAQAKGLCAGYDGVLFGCSTWGDDSIELQDDFASFFDEFDNLEVEGVKFAVFGCGDINYQYFCGAVDEIERKLNELGAQLIDNNLKIDGEPHAAKEDIKVFADYVAARL